MIVNFRKLDPAAEVPRRATKGAAGFDLVVTSVALVEEDNKVYVELGTGLAVAIPAGWKGLLYPRSSISNTGFVMANSVGVVDSDYRGEIKIRVAPLRHQLYGLTSPYNIGDRCAQIDFERVQSVEFNQVDDLEETERGDGGFGSTLGWGKL